ncbi:hypothetical protein [Rhizobium sp. PAMB 3182]
MPFNFRDCIICASICGALAPSVVGALSGFTGPEGGAWLVAAFASSSSFVAIFGPKIALGLLLVLVGVVTALYVATPADAKTAFINGISAPALITTLIANVPASASTDQVPNVGVVKDTMVTSELEFRERAVPFRIFTAAYAEDVGTGVSGGAGVSVNDGSLLKDQVLKFQIQEIQGDCSSCTIEFFDASGKAIADYPLGDKGALVEVPVPDDSGTATISGIEGTNAGQFDVQSALSAQDKADGAIFVGKTRSFENDLLNTFGNRAVLPYDLQLKVDPNS